MNKFTERNIATKINQNYQWNNAAKPFALSRSQK